MNRTLHFYRQAAAIVHHLGNAADALDLRSRQGRFGSFVMDEPYLLAAARYVESNPVRAGLVGGAGEWPWSSARPRLLGRDDRLVKVAPLLTMAGDWNALLNSGLAEEELRDLRLHSRTGRPLGSTTFVERLERIVGRVLTRNKPGRKPRLLKHLK